MLVIIVWERSESREKSARGGVGGWVVCRQLVLFFWRAAGTIVAPCRGFVRGREGTRHVPKAPRSAGRAHHAGPPRLGGVLLSLHVQPRQAAAGRRAGAVLPLWPADRGRLCRC